MSEAIEQRLRSVEAELAALKKRFDARELPRGRWVRVDQEVVLNTPKQSDGAARLWLDGKLEIEVKAVDIRDDANMAISGAVGDVFFGGSGTHGKASKEAVVWLSPFELRWT